MPSLLTKGGDSTARGAAKDTTENREYLAHCDAVRNFKADGETISFTYDPEKQPAESPEGIMWDLSEAAF